MIHIVHHVRPYGILPVPPQPVYRITRRAPRFRVRDDRPGRELTPWEIRKMHDAERRERRRA